MSRPIDGQYREPPGKGGKPGLLFSREAIAINATSAKLVRSGRYDLGQAAEYWNGHTIQIAFSLEDAPRLGFINSYGFAEDIAGLTGLLTIYRDEDEGANYPYIIDYDLRIDLRVTPTFFASIWGDMISRPGCTVRLSINFPVLSIDPKQQSRRLRSAHFIELLDLSEDAAAEEIESRVYVGLLIEDVWET